MSCAVIISIDKAMIVPIYYKGNLLVIWDYFIEKAILDCINEKKSTKLPYLCIYYKLIDRGFRKYMSFDDIIGIDKAMTGNIYYKGNLLVI